MRHRGRRLRRVVRTLGRFVLYGLEALGYLNYQPFWVYDPWRAGQTRPGPPGSADGADIDWDGVERDGGDDAGFGCDNGDGLPLDAQERATWAVLERTLTRRDST